MVSENGQRVESERSMWAWPGPSLSRRSDAPYIAEQISLKRRGRLVSTPLGKASCGGKATIVALP